MKNKLISFFLMLVLAVSCMGYTGMPHIEYIKADWREEIDLTGRDIRLTKADVTEHSLETIDDVLYGKKWVKWNVNIPADGNYKAVYNGGARDADMPVMLAADAHALYATIPQTELDWKEVELGTFPLRKGTHTLLLVNQASTDSGSAPDFEVILKPGGAYAPNMADITYSALAFDIKENMAASHMYYDTGAVYMPQYNYAAEYVVDVPAGNYDLSLFYGVRTTDGSGKFKVYVDGVDYGTLTLADSGAGYMIANKWSDALTCIRLAEGRHTIRIDKETKGNIFTFSKFKLTPIVKPVVQIYYGSDAVVGSQTAASISEGSMTARVLFPSAMNGKPVKMFFAVYECDGTSKRLIAVNSADFTGTSNTAKAVTVNGIKFTDGKTYESRVIFLDGLMTLKPYYSAMGTLTN